MARGWAGLRAKWICPLILGLLLAACDAPTEQRNSMPSPLPTPVSTTEAGNAPLVVAIVAPEDAAEEDVALMGMGKALYATNCAPCHQINGEGTLGTFPSLNRNAFVRVSDPTGVIDTVLHGRRIMPGFAVTLSDQEVAAVLSYVRNAWNNQASLVSAEQVSTVRESGRESGSEPAQAAQ